VVRSSAASDVYKRQAIYLFLRGVHSPTAGCCHVAPPLALLNELDGMLASGARATTGETA
jgi:hypothetical protein